VFLEFNDRFCEMTGYDREELLGRSSRILYATQEDYDHVGTVKYGQIARTGTGTVETQWKRKDGRIVDVWLSSSAIDRTDLSKGVAFTAMDITAAKEIQARLHRSEQTLRETEAIAHVGSFRRDLRTNAIAWSDETYRIYGYAPGEVSPSADLVWSHIHPEDRERFVGVTGMPQGVAQPEAITYRIIRNDGQVRTLHARPSFEYDGSGAPVRLLGALQDITDYEQARQALYESENKFKTLADESFDSIAIHDGTTIMEVNGTFCRAWGYRPQEAIGQKVDQFIAPASMLTVEENIARGCDRPYEIIAVRKDGTTFPAEIVVNPRINRHLYGLT
jgi:PAS domain S-box-containing protein